MLKKIFLIIMAALLVCGAAVASEEQELLYIVRNRMEFNNYPFDLDYLPFGQQLDKFFEKGEWNVEYDDNANIFAVFKGIGRYDELLGITKHFGRKAWITVKVGRKKLKTK